MIITSAKYQPFQRSLACFLMTGIVISGKVFTEDEYKAVLDLIEASQTVQSAASHQAVLTQLVEVFHELV